MISRISLIDAFRIFNRIFDAMFLTIKMRALPQDFGIPAINPDLDVTSKNVYYRKQQCRCRRCWQLGGSLFLAHAAVGVPT